VNAGLGVDVFLVNFDRALADAHVFGDLVVAAVWKTLPSPQNWGEGG